MYKFLQSDFNFGWSEILNPLFIQTVKTMIMMDVKMHQASPKRRSCTSAGVLNHEWLPQKAEMRHVSRIPICVYMDAFCNNYENKLPLSIGIKFFSEQKYSDPDSDQNLICMFT